LVAHDKGPFQTLLHLSRYDQFFFVDSIHNLESIDHWIEALSKLNVVGVVLSTSKSESGFIVESFCCIAAKELGLLVVVIEDYPFNFNSAIRSFVDLILVESDFVKNEYLRSGMFDVESIETGALIRYENIRAVALSLRQRSTNRIDKKSRVLWLGQPETHNCLASLERIMPSIKSLGLNLDFRAHPDDFGYYDADNYANLFYNYKDCLEDVSFLKIDSCVQRNPIFAITQFSSLAIELGFQGIPSLHLLYEDLGGAFFLHKNGRVKPVICEVGASPIITKAGEEYSALSKLKLESYRNSIIDAFNNYYSINSSLLSIINKINALDLSR
jgi:hypothetical protein